MKRLGRWLFNLAAVVSSVLFGITVLLWIRSFIASDIYYDARVWGGSAWGDSRWRQRVVWSGSGVVGYAIEQGINGSPLVDAQPLHIRSAPWTRGIPRPWRVMTVARKSFFGVEYGTSSLAPEVWRREIVAPYWLVAAAFAPIPATWLLQWELPRRRVRAGRCAFCGYDLRATPERCPECGKVPNAIEARRT